MTTKDEALRTERALKLALEALDGLYLPGELERVNTAITAIRAALASKSEALAEQPAQPQEPVVNAKAIAECLGVLRPLVRGKWPHEQVLEELAGYTSPQPAHTSKPVAVASMPGCRLEWLIGETISHKEVAELCEKGATLYTSPPSLSLAQRKPLTDEQAHAMWAAAVREAALPRSKHVLILYKESIEAAHGITGETQ